MKVTITVDVGPEERAGINRRTGTPGLATREQVREWAQSLIEETFPDIRDEGGHRDWDEDDAEAMAAGNFV